MTSSAIQRPTVSVALCTHNGERFLEAQLRSILGQSYPPSQLVLSDDDSTDATVELAVAIVDEYVSTNPDRKFDFTVLRNSPALGVAKNFEQAIRACTSELVALSDQDDVWRNDRLAEVAATFNRRPEVCLLHSDARLIDDFGKSLGTTLFAALGVTAWEHRTETKGDALSVLVRRNLVTGATAVFRRSIVDRALPIPPGWIHDEWLGIVAAAIDRVDIDPRPLVDYRQHVNNQIGAAKLSFVDKLRKLREPRMERNRNLLIRARELVARLDQLGDVVDPRTRRIAWEKQEHERFRVALPPNRFLRIIPVLATAARGGYARYGLGPQDVLRDLVQPAE